MSNENTSYIGNENIDPAEETPTAAPDPAGGHLRTGKIARLPWAVRQELNRRMRDGESNGSLVDWLHGLPEVLAILATQFQGRRILPQNLSHWRGGGHQDFLKEEETRREVRTVVEEIKGLKDESKDGLLTDQLAFYMAAQVAVELKQWKAATDGVEKDKRWRELLASVVALRRGDLEAERVRMQLEKLGLRRQTQEERVAEFWKWAGENINRDEFCRRRCYTAAEREAAINKILGITPQERGEVVPEPAAPPPVDPSRTEG